MQEMRRFRTAEPIQEDIHCIVPQLDRADTPAAFESIRSRKCFLLMHAPRQRGRTSVILALSRLSARPGDIARSQTALEFNGAAGQWRAGSGGRQNMHRLPGNLDRLIYRDQTLAEGLSRTAGYMDKSGAAGGHFAVFNRDRTVSWEQRVWTRDPEQGETRIRAWDM